VTNMVEINQINFEPLVASGTSRITGRPTFGNKT